MTFWYWSYWDYTALHARDGKIRGATAFGGVPKRSERANTFSHERKIQVHGLWWISQLSPSLFPTASPRVTQDFLCLSHALTHTHTAGKCRGSFSPAFPFLASGLCEFVSFSRHVRFARVTNAFWPTDCLYFLERNIRRELLGALLAQSSGSVNAHLHPGQLINISKPKTKSETIQNVRPWSPRWRSWRSDRQR